MRSAAVLRVYATLWSLTAPLTLAVFAIGVWTTTLSILLLSYNLRPAAGFHGVVAYGVLPLIWSLSSCFIGIGLFRILFGKQSDGVRNWRMIGICGAINALMLIILLPNAALLGWANPFETTKSTLSRVLLAYHMLIPPMASILWLVASLSRISKPPSGILPKDFA